MSRVNSSSKKGSIIGPFFFLILSGCVSYQSDVSDPYRKMTARQPQAAAEMLKEKAFKEGADQLVYLLEYATALHEAKDYKGSTSAFLKAYDMVQIKDFHSISKVTASLLLNEGMIQYKGEDFEKVMVNVYLALNFLMMGDLESAAVETRRINEILYKFKIEAKKPYDQSPLARYLSAIIWEADRNWDSMYIDYKNTYDLAPSFLPLVDDLLWGSRRARRPEDFERWKTQFQKTEFDKTRDNKDLGEVVVIYQQGQGPVKQPHPGWHRIPKLYARSQRGLTARVTFTPEKGDAVTLTTNRLFSLEETAIKNLDDQYAEIIAKRAAGIATKAVVADQIRQKNELLGSLAWIGMNLADQADLRQWTFLPSSFHVARQRLAPGQYKVRAEALDGSGEPTGEVSEEMIVVKAKAKTFWTWRSFL